MVVRIAQVSKEGSGSSNPGYLEEDLQTVRSQAGLIDFGLLNIRMVDSGGNPVGADLTGLIGRNAEGAMDQDEHWVALPCPPHCPDTGKHKTLSFDEITTKYKVRKNLWQGFKGMVKRLFSKKK